MSKEQLLLAREYIAKGEIEKARAILLALGDNPTAREWLAKLDKRTAAPKAEPANELPEPTPADELPQPTYSGNPPSSDSPRFSEGASNFASNAAAQIRNIDPS